MHAELFFFFFSLLGSYFHLAFFLPLLLSLLVGGFGPLLALNLDFLAEALL
jgi:hypothetical protein